MLRLPEMLNTQHNWLPKTPHKKADAKAARDAQHAAQLASQDATQKAELDASKAAHQAELDMIKAQQMQKDAEHADAV